MGSEVGPPSPVGSGMARLLIGNHGLLRAQHRLSALPTPSRGPVGPGHPCGWGSIYRGAQAAGPRVGLRFI